jgi:hypothetical protein
MMAFGNSDESPEQIVRRMLRGAVLPGPTKLTSV